MVWERSMFRGVLMVGRGNGEERGMHTFIFEEAVPVELGGRDEVVLDAPVVWFSAWEDMVMVTC